MSTHDLESSKSIYIFKNGDYNFPGKRMVVSSDIIWEQFLSRITRALQCKIPIREICAAANTSEKILCFDDLKNNGKYVGLVECETLCYKNGGYKTTSERAEHQRRPAVLLRDFGKVKSSSLNTIIYVFENGIDNKIAIKFVLTKDDMNHYERILRHIGQSLDIPNRGDCKSLYTVNGRWVQGPYQLQSGAFYVAVKYHQTFMFLEYLQVYKKYPKYLKRMRIEDSFGGLKKFKLYNDNGIQNIKEYSQSSLSQVGIETDTEDEQNSYYQSSSESESSEFTDTDSDNESNKLFDMVTDNEQINVPMPSVEDIAKRYLNEIAGKLRATSIEVDEHLSLPFLPLPLNPTPITTPELNPDVENSGRRNLNKTTIMDAKQYDRTKDFDPVPVNK